MPTNNSLFDNTIEEAVIASVIQNPSCYIHLRDYVVADDFYWPFYKQMWITYLSIEAKGLKLDKITIINELNKIGLLDGLRIYSSGENILGYDAIEYFYNYEIDTENFLSYASLLKEDRAKREINLAIEDAKNKISQGSESRA